MPRRCATPWPRRCARDGAAPGRDRRSPDRIDDTNRADRNCDDRTARCCARAALAGARCRSLPPLAAAQAWPAKPIKVVVNFPPGGAADQIARAIGQPLQEALGQPVVIENRGGSGGNVGGDAVAKSPPDGYTLLMSSGGMVSVNPHIYPKMPFDPAKDLMPVAAAARVLVFLVVQAEFPANDVKEFLADLKANPGKLSYGSPGNGSSPHLAGRDDEEPGRRLRGARALPRRGAGADRPARRPDRLRCSTRASRLPHVQAGQLRLLAVGSPKRSPLFPDVPTLDEVGPEGLRRRHGVRLLRAGRHAAPT